MSQKIVVTCDECGAERKEANHWFSLLASATNPRLSAFDAASRQAEGGFRLDFCGQRCVMTAIQRWLDTGTVIDSPDVPAFQMARVSPAEKQNPQSTPRLIAMHSR